VSRLDLLEEVFLANTYSGDETSAKIPNEGDGGAG